MKKRFVRFVAVLIAAFIVALGVVPVRSSAIVPLGLVQSALASYVTSAGYKLYNDQGTGQDILGSLGDLYDDYVSLNNKTISGSLATLAYLANSPLIYTDNSGQICINAVAANVMQDFVDWMQSEYSVPVGSDVPTAVVSGDLSGSFPTYQRGGTIQVSSLTDPIDLYRYAISKSPRDIYLSSSAADAVTTFLSSHSGDAFCISLYLSDSGAYSGNLFTLYAKSFSGGSLNLTDVYCLTFAANGSAGASDSTITVSTYSETSRSVYLWVGERTQSGIFECSNINASLSSSPALAVSLAHAVTDVVGQAADDDAVVVGVGAGVGATAQDIAGLVADGIKAGTLEPSVSIVAEDVIDTPVQPYPDIDGLGLPQLGAALTDRFPFCIPWDFVGALKLLNAEPIPPVFDVPLVPDSVKARWGVSGDTTLHVDLTTQEYAKLFLAIRWGTLIGFCIGLTLLTKRLIWTA